MNSLAEILGVLASVLSAVITIYDKKLEKSWHRAQVQFPDRPIALEEKNFFIKKKIRKMISSKVLSGAGPGFYWFHHQVLEEITGKRRKRARTIVPAVIILGGLLVWAIIKLV